MFSVNFLPIFFCNACRVKQLETVRFELCTKNADLQHKIVALQSKSHEVLSQGLPQDKDTIEELELKVISTFFSEWARE